MTLAVRFETKPNSLNFLRLLLATAVIVSHAWPLGGYGPDPAIAGQTIGTWAVAGFFAISGYLITNSRLHLPMASFVMRRILRIYPAYLVCLAVIVILFAPLSVMLGSGSISWFDAGSFLGHNLFLKTEQNGISNTLGAVPYPRAWDGSLWTLFYEFVCYLLIGALLALGLRLGRAVVPVALVGAAGLNIMEVHRGASGTLADFAFLSPIFLAGALLAVYAERIVLDWRLAIAALAVLPVCSSLHVMASLGAIPAAYAFLWLGLTIPLDRVGRRNDISYGVYIYAFPVQQILAVLHANRLPVGAFVILSIIGTVPFAVASWFAVEKPAIALKQKFKSKPATRKARHASSSRLLAKPTSLPVPLAADSEARR